MVAAEDIHLELLDIKTAFLHSDLEDIYMMYPQSYITPEKEQLVCKLKKSLWPETGFEVVISEVLQIHD